MNIHHTTHIFGTDQTTRRPVRAALLALLTLLAWSGAATAQDANGLCRVTESGGGDGSSWSMPMQLQAALTTDGCSEIHVAAGLYKPADDGTVRTVSFVIDRALTLYGGYPAAGASTRDPAANVTILSGDLDSDDEGINGISETADQTKGNNAYHVVTISAPGADVTVDGFVITAGRASSGSGANGYGANVYVTAGNATLRQLRITGGRAYRGGGLYLDNVSPQIEQVEISGNYAVNYGGGLYCNASGDSCSPAITNVTFSGNYTGGGGSGGAMSNYGGISGVSSPTLTNVTFNGNSAGLQGGAIYNDGFTGISQPTLVNVILWGDTVVNSGTGPEIYNRSATTSIGYSIIEGGCESGDGNACTAVSTGNPLLGSLQDNGGLTFTMLPGDGSPAIDNGTNDGCPATDQRGYARPQGGSCDIGAVEIGFPPGTCLVDASATGAHDGSNWGDAYTNLQAASGNSTCTTIQVAAGVYKPTQPAQASTVTDTERGVSFVIDRALELYGGYPTGGGDSRDPAANPTILSGDLDNNDGDDNADGNYISESFEQTTGSNSYHVVRIDAAGADVTLDGFVITAGFAEGTSGIDDRGAGLDLEAGNVTLQQLRFSGNRAADGGGLYILDASPSLDSVAFEGNFAEHAGGGLYCDGRGSGHACDPALTHVTFTDNGASSSGGDGGGMFNNGYDDGTSNPSLRDVVFTDNYAKFGGAMHNFAKRGTSSPTLNNVTFKGNYAFGNGGAIYNNAFEGISSPSLTNVTFSGNGAQSRGGAIFNNGAQGGASNPVLRNVTFFANAAFNAGGGIYNYAAANPELTNVVLWNNAGGQMQNEAGGTATLDHSIVQGGCPTDDTCTNLVTGDPRLVTLNDNGGFTQTYLPGAGSAAIDTGTCVAQLTTDQRDVARPQGSGCDIGAVEVREATLTINVSSGDGTVSAADEPRANGGTVIAGCTATGGACSANYSIEPAAPTVTLHLLPDPGYAAAAVTSDCAGLLSGNDYVSAPISADCTLEISFAPVTYNLSYAAGPHGSVMGTLAQSAAYGGDGEPVTALANERYHFVDWSDGSTANPRTDTNIHGDIDVTANFAVNTHTVAASVNGGNGSVSPASQQVVEGTVAQISATPDSDYHATLAASSTCPAGAWNGNNYSSGAIIADCAIVVDFVANPPPKLSLVVSDSRAYQHYGGLNNYLVAVTNTSPYETASVRLSDTVPAQVDPLDVHWICVPGASGGGCQASGQGPLHTTGTIPPGVTLTWSVTAKVLPDAAGANVVYNMLATPNGGDATVQATDSDTLVVFRDGFGGADSQGNLEFGLAAASAEPVRLDDDRLWTFSVPAAGMPMQIVMILAAHDGRGVGFRVERLQLGTLPRVRLVTIDSDGHERASVWSITQPGARLVLASSHAGHNQRTLLLEGADTPLALPWPADLDNKLHVRARKAALLQVVALQPHG